MNKNHIWIGHFLSEEDFENYFDQTSYYEAWNKYNNEPSKEGEEDIEPDNKVSCKFCQEIGIDYYDEDFVFTHYELSEKIEALISRIPADTSKILAICNQKQIVNANAFFCYSSEELEENALPENSKKLVYLGEFTEEKPTALIEDENTRLGLTDLIWIGNIKESKDEFMKYFDQSEYMDLLSQNKKPKVKHSCEFCEDTGIAYYLSQNCHLYFSDLPKSVSEILRESISHVKLRERIEFDLEGTFSPNAKFNVLVHFTEHETVKAKEEPKFKIYPKELLERYSLPKGFIEEKDNYNGLKYIGAFDWS